MGHAHIIDSRSIAGILWIRSMHKYIICSLRFQWIEFWIPTKRSTRSAIETFSAYNVFNDRVDTNEQSHRMSAVLYFFHRPCVVVPSNAVLFIHNLSLVVVVVVVVATVHTCRRTANRFHLIRIARGDIRYGFLWFLLLFNVPIK